MKKLYIAIAFISLSIFTALIYFKVRCKEPTELEVIMVRRDCVIKILNQPIEDLRNDACEYLGKEHNCEFVHGDGRKIIEMIDKKIYACSKAELEAQNLCTGKLEK